VRRIVALEAKARAGVLLLRLLLLGAGGAHCAVDGRKDGARVEKETLARRKQLHPARRPREQGGPEFVLERADLAAHRRLRDVEALGGTTDVPFLGNGDEIADLRDAPGPEHELCRVRSQAAPPDRNGIGHARFGCVMQEGP